MVVVAAPILKTFKQEDGSSNLKVVLMEAIRRPLLRLEDGWNKSIVTDLGRQLARVI